METIIYTLWEEKVSKKSECSETVFNNPMIAITSSERCSLETISFNSV